MPSEENKDIHQVRIKQCDIHKEKQAEGVMIITLS